MAEWKPVSELTPKGGDQIWAYLFQTGIRLLEWRSAETAAAEFGGTEDEYDPAWVEVDDRMQEWEPKWYLPVDAIPTLPVP